MVMLLRALILLLICAMPVRADTLRLIAPDIQPVVGEMIPVTVRGEYTGRISLETMTFPDSPDYDWIQLARDRWATERVEGRLLRVFERRIAVFPRQPGTLTIGPVTHRLTKSEGMTRPVFDIVAPPISRTVLPYPGIGRTLASSYLTVTDDFSADPSQLGHSETFTRRIVITAQNSMAHLLPPRPVIREPWLISFAAPEVRETRLTVDGPVAIVVWEWSLRPHTGEMGSLTPLQFPWFDTVSREKTMAITLPVQIGIAGFGDNIDGAGPSVTAQATGIAAAGLVLGVFAAGWGRTPAPRLLAARLRRMRRNPHIRALRDAARQDDLMTLRRVADDYARAETASGRPVDPAILRMLDRALFSPRATDSFDRAAFLRRLTGRG